MPCCFLVMCLKICMYLCISIFYCLNFVKTIFPIRLENSTIFALVGKCLLEFSELSYPRFVIVTSEKRTFLIISKTKSEPKRFATIWPVFWSTWNGTGTSSLHVVQTGPIRPAKGRNVTWTERENTISWPANHKWSFSIVKSL